MDITNRRLLYFKGTLLLFGGIFATSLLFLEGISWKGALLHLLAIWCFSRAYYFAFYVIQHYVDPQYRFAGLTHFLRYLLSRRNQSSSFTQEHDKLKP